MNNWHYAIDRESRGPVLFDALKTMARDGRLRREDLVWNETLATWITAGSVANLFEPQDPPSLPLPPVTRAADGTRVVAALCGIFLGFFGVHKFVLGLNTAGLIMLGVTIATCGFGGLLMHSIGFIEGVIYLTASDEMFYQRYIIEKKEWF